MYALLLVRYIVDEHVFAQAVSAGEENSTLINLGNSRDEGIKEVTLTEHKGIDGHTCFCTIFHFS